MNNESGFGATQREQLGLEVERLGGLAKTAGLDECALAVEAALGDGDMELAELAVMLGSRWVDGRQQRLERAHLDVALALGTASAIATETGEIRPDEEPWAGGPGSLRIAEHRARMLVDLAQTEVDSISRMVREWRATLRRGVVGAFGPLVRKLAALEDILWALWEHPAVVGVGLDLRNIRWDGGRRTWQVRHTCGGSERLVGSFAVARFGGCREAAEAAVEARDRHLLGCAGAVAPGGLRGALAQ